MKNRRIKILCVCNKGNCRSVGTRHCLNKRLYNNVISIGATNTSPYTLTMLCEWADKILLAKPYHIDYLPRGFENKVDSNFTIGEDVWNNPLNRKLHELINEKLDSIGLT